MTWGYSPGNPIEDIKRAFTQITTQLRNGPPPIYAIMADKQVPWPKTFRQWTADGRLLVWVNADALMKFVRRDDKPEYLIDHFIGFEPVMVPIIFTDKREA